MVYGMAWQAWHLYGLAWYLVWPGRHGMVWPGRAWCGIWYYLGRHDMIYMEWPGRHGICYGLTGIWYGLADMAWYMVWPGRHDMVYGMAWQA